VAINTAHAGVAHATEKHGGPVEVFVALLAIGIKRGGVCREGHAVVVVVVVARFKGGGECFVASVAGSARLHHERTVSAKRVVHGGGVVGLLGVGGGLFAVALDAADALFNPVGMVGVGVGGVVWGVAGHVALGAHRVPIHATACPVPPFARLAILGGEDVEPVFSAWVIGNLVRLPASTRLGDERLPEGRVPQNHQRWLRICIRQPARKSFQGGDFSRVGQSIGEAVVSALPSLENGVVTGATGFGGLRNCGVNYRCVRAILCLEQGGL
jgi:hypothetical protein